MFDSYMQHQQADPRRRMRIAVAGNVAGTLTAGLLVFTWIADKMQIAQVEAPTSDYVMFQLLESSAVPPPPPPPAPKGNPDADEDNAREKQPEDEPVPVEDLAPDPTPRNLVASRPKTTGPRGIPDGHDQGVPGGKKGGIPGFQGPGITTGLPPIVGTPQPTKKAAPPEPISALKARCVYCPDPKRSDLAATTAGMFHRRSGTNKTFFCVNETGRVSEARTTQKFPQDPEVDRICRDTVKKWRVKPRKIGGKAVKSCSTVSFELSFK